jgi:hypothetical protein
MGDLSDPGNTFYELFARPTGSATWKLTTPPGAADNGGLVVGSDAAGAVAAGFLPSADLTFSVLATSPDGGTTWNPGEVPGALAAEPDGLAVGGSGQVEAVLAGTSGGVVSSSDGGVTWGRTTSMATLAGASHTCTVTRVTAVALTVSGSPVVGTRCVGSGTVGLFVPSNLSSGWSPISGTSDVSGPSTTTVLRLQADAGGVSALVEDTSGGARTLKGAWATEDLVASALSTSAPLAVPAGWSVRATATGGGSGTGLTVLLGDDSGPGLRVESVAGPDQGWVVSPRPPVGTSAVATVGGETDAFVPSRSHLTIWATSPGSTVWSRSAQLTVPIQYGSSQ